MVPSTCRASSMILPRSFMIASSDVPETVARVGCEVVTSSTTHVSLYSIAASAFFRPFLLKAASRAESSYIRRGPAALLEPFLDVEEREPAEDSCNNQGRVDHQERSVGQADQRILLKRRNRPHHPV